MPSHAASPDIDRNANVYIGGQYEPPRVDVSLGRASVAGELVSNQEAIQTELLDGFQKALITAHNGYDATARNMVTDYHNALEQVDETGADPTEAMNKALEEQRFSVGHLVSAQRDVLDRKVNQYSRMLWGSLTKADKRRFVKLDSQIREQGYEAVEAQVAGRSVHNQVMRRLLELGTYRRVLSARADGHSEDADELVSHIKEPNLHRAVQDVEASAIWEGARAAASDLYQQSVGTHGFNDASKLLLEQLDRMPITAARQAMGIALSAPLVERVHRAAINGVGEGDLKNVLALVPDAATREFMSTRILPGVIEQAAKPRQYSAEEEAAAVEDARKRDETKAANKQEQLKREVESLDLSIWRIDARQERGTARETDVADRELYVTLQDALEKGGTGALWLNEGDNVSAVRDTIAYVKAQRLEGRSDKQIYMGLHPDLNKESNTGGTLARQRHDILLALLGGSPKGKLTF